MADEMRGNGRYRLSMNGNVVVVTDALGSAVLHGTVEDAHQLATVLNRFLLYGETSEDEPPVAWLSTGDAVALSQQQGGPGKDAIRRAARNGRFAAEKDSSDRWQYERAGFMRWLLDDAAHQPGRKD